MHWLVHAFRRPGERITLLLSRRRRILGVRVCLFTDDQEAVSERVAGALQVLAQYDPRSFRNLAKYINLIWVRRLFAVMGQYNQDINACELDAAYVLRPGTTAGLLASTIVHETMHARIAAWGIRFTPPRRARIERLCREAELRFAARLPAPQEVEKKARAGLAMPDDSWTDATMHRRRLEAQFAFLEEVNMPRWFIRYLRRVVARRRARRMKRAA